MVSWEFTRIAFSAEKYNPRAVAIYDFKFHIIKINVQSLKAHAHTYVRHTYKGRRKGINAAELPRGSPKCDFGHLALSARKPRGKSAYKPGRMCETRTRVGGDRRKGMGATGTGSSVFWPAIMATANHHRYFENFITLLGCARRLGKGGRISSASVLHDLPHTPRPLTHLGNLAVIHYIWKKYLFHMLKTTFIK